VSLYDSKSTLASVSSLDVSNVLETNKSFQNDNPPTPLLRSKDSNAKQTLKLAEELMLKEEQIAQLELRIHDIVAASTREIESLKNSNVKYERSVQVRVEFAYNLSVLYCFCLHHRALITKIPCIIVPIEGISINCDV